MGYSLLDVSAVISALAGIWILKRSLTKRNLPPVPPGPTSLPLIGNVLDMPKGHEWLTVKKLGDKYGPVVSLTIFGKRYIFLNSSEAAVELLERRGGNYSSRPPNVMFELEGFTGWFTGAMPYDTEVKMQRQMMHRFLQLGVLDDYYQIEVHAACKLLERLLQSPGSYEELAFRYASEIIMKVAYGHEVGERDDPFVAVGKNGMQAFSEAEGFFPVNIFPWMRYLPAWFPGTSFKRIAAEGYKHSIALKEKPHEMMKKRMADGKLIPSMWSKLMEANVGENGVVENEELIGAACANAYAGGADTIVSALVTFVLLMILYPETQKRAQEELDRVIGKNSLPSFEDRPNLPYVEALFKECLRFQPVGPLGAAHLVEEDDEYNGYHLPAGSILFPNIWAMSRDAEMYPEPDKFIPERWLPKNGNKLPLDPRKMIFSFGRRACPGRYFADNAIFIVIASVLSAFNISNANDEKGQPITPEVKYTPHLITHPEPFQYSITPRSIEIANAIHQAIEATK